MFVERSSERVAHAPCSRGVVGRWREWPLRPAASIARLAASEPTWTIEAVLDDQLVIRPRAHRSTADAIAYSASSAASTPEPP